LYPDFKNRAVPVLHRDFFVAKVDAQLPALRQVTPSNFIAGPLGGMVTRPLKNKKSGVITLMAWNSEKSY